MPNSDNVTLRDFFIEKLDALAKSTESARSALEKNVETARAALEKNVDLARSSLEKNNEVSRIALEKRLDSMNEFREALKDQANSYITRAEMALIMAKIDSDIRILREGKAATEGGASRSSVNVAMAISVIGTLISFFFHH